MRRPERLDLRGLLEAVEGAPPVEVVDVVAATLAAGVDASYSTTRMAPEDRARLNGYVTAIMAKTGFNRARFIAEVRRATTGRQVAA